MQSESRLDIALKLAAEGYYIFPLVANGKVPESGSNWRHVSTRNSNTINRWFKCPVTGWEQDHNIGIDCGKSGLCVIDVDTKEGKDGARSFTALELEYGFPDTREVITQSGGEHHYYRADGYGNTQGDNGGIAPGIDTRGNGGYVVAPGSEIDGRFYRWKNEIDISPLPSWLEAMLNGRKIKEKDTASAVSELDHSDDIERAIDWLKNHAAPACEGAGGDHHTFTVACKVRDFGVSRDMAFQLMLEYWNVDCLPPWDSEDLQKKVDNAYQYARNPAGVASAHAEFEGPLETQENKLPFRDGSNPRTASEIPQRKWIYGRLALSKQVTIIGAPGGAGKSTLMLTIALSKASGKEFMGMPVYGRGAVAVWNQEDDYDELERRQIAAMQFYGLTNEDLKYNGRSLFFLGSGEIQPLKIAKKIGLNGTIKPHDMEPLIHFVRQNQIELLIVDPFAETHPANENNNEEIIQVGMLYRRIAQDTGCAVILIHHTKKPDKGSSDGFEGEMDALRGASGLTGIARIIATFFSISEKVAKQYDISQDRRKYYARLIFAKANMSLEKGSEHWFERVSQDIGNIASDPDSGDKVGVLKPVVLAKKAKLERLSNGPTIREDRLQQIISEFGGSISKADARVEFYNFLADKAPNTKANAFSRAVEKLIATNIITQDSQNLILMNNPHSQISQNAHEL